MDTNLLTLAIGDAPPLVANTPDVDDKHPQWKELEHTYDLIDILVRGGTYALKAAPALLYRRPREANDVYAKRCEQMTYQNLVGACMAWYVASLFKEQWMPAWSKAGAPLAEEPNPFYGRFVKNVDRKGSDFNAFLAAAFEAVLKFGSAWVLTDLPNIDPAAFRSAADQADAGATDPFWLLYDARNVINWSTDDTGVLEWVVIWVPTERRGFRTQSQVVDRWYYFDRQTYEVYESLRPSGALNANSSKATVVSSGSHALASVGRVPVRRLAVPELFWLCNRVFPQALDHLNLDNTYAWALRMANLPVPAVIGDYEEPPSHSETELTVLPNGSRFEWLEPKGTSFQRSEERLSSLREEIYRQVYLQAHGKDASASASSSSGYAKDMDMRPAQEVCARFAGWLRNWAAGMFRDVADARGDMDIEASVSGAEFEEEDLNGAIATLDLADEAGIPSDTLDKALKTEVALKLARNQPVEIQEKIRAEIEQAPTKSAVEAARASAAKAALEKSMATAVDRKEADGVAKDV